MTSTVKEQTRPNRQVVPSVLRNRTLPGHHTQAGRGRAVLLVGLGLVLVAVSVLAAAPIGASNLDFSQVWSSVGGRLGFPVEPLTRAEDSLIWDLRLPRTLMAALVGAILALSGVVLQSLTRNDLADPYLLGMSSGASFGAVLVVSLGLTSSAIGLTMGAFVGGLASIALLLLLIGRTGLDALRVVLVGIIVGQLFNAVMSVTLVASADAETTRAMTFWLMGSMSAARWGNVLVAVVLCVAAVVIMMGFHRSLDVMSFGADTAQSLGVPVARTRFILLLTTALLTAACVASVGAIGFVGLVVPHLARFLVGPGHLRLLPVSAVLGGVLLVWADALSRVAFAPREVPVGTLTALIGVPIFCVVMKRRGVL